MYFSITVDTNGYSGPNTIGRDIQYILVLGNKVIPAGSTETNVAQYAEAGCAMNMPVVVVVLSF